MLFRLWRRKKDEYDEAVEMLDKKLEEMWKRLDGTYQVNNGNR